MSRVKELRKENIKKQKLAEVKFEQEKILAELKKIEAEEAKYINWRRDLGEGMTTDSLGMINLPADPDTIQTSIPSTTISSADNLGSPTEDGIVPRIQSFQVVDASKTDTITLKISGSFNTKTIDGTTLSDKVSVGVLNAAGNYGGGYLAGGGDNNGLGNGTHTLTIPQKFRKAGVTFDVMQIYAFDGGEGAQSSSVSITGVGLKRVNRMNVFVSLDDPESLPFHRGGLGGSEEKKKQLQDMLEAGNEWMVRNGLEPSRTSPGDIQLGPPPPVSVADGRRTSPTSTTPPQAVRDAYNMRWDPVMKAWLPNRA